VTKGQVMMEVEPLEGLQRKEGIRVTIVVEFASCSDPYELDVLATIYRKESTRGHRSRGRGTI